MPGIFGFTKDSLDDTTARLALEDMQRLVHHSVTDTLDPLYHANAVCGSRVHLAIERGAQPVAAGGLLLWLDGELYHQEEVKARHQLEASSSAELLLQLYQKHQDLSFLPELDGLFSAVLFDTRAQRAFLFCDRYGLCHLYYAVVQGRLAWATEQKAFLAVPGFTPKLAQASVETFFFVGQLIENQSWLEGVRLLASGAVLTWDLRAGIQQQGTYWSWSSIKPTPEASEDDIAEEMLRLFKASVVERCGGDRRVGLLLSGGVDSRAILASMPAREDPIHAVTFGTLYSDDVRIARVIARKKGAVHHVLELSAENWLEQRVAANWWCDGQLELLHMHAVLLMHEGCYPFDINLDGFCGSIISAYYETNPSANFAIKMQERARRFAIMGAKVLGVKLHTRLPFMDNKLVEFSLGLPLRVRYDNKIYKKMLLRGFDEYYRNIPWQLVGMPINWPKAWLPYVKQLRVLRDRISARNQGTAIQRTLGTSQFVDYVRWMRSRPTAAWMRATLESSEALYPEYLPKAQVLDWLHGHLSGHDFSIALSRVLTFEVWLQQLFAGRYRPALLPTR